jgi:hypothetical protein
MSGMTNNQVKITTRSKKIERSKMFYARTQRKPLGNGPVYISSMTEGSQFPAWSPQEKCMAGHKAQSSLPYETPNSEGSQTCGGNPGPLYNSSRTEAG